MSQFKLSGVMLAFWVCFSAFGKITVHTNEQILTYLLSSAELAALKQKGQPLHGLKLYRTNVNKIGNGGIGTIYDVQLHFRADSGLLTVCGVTGRVMNTKAPNTPPGIIASVLSRPKMSEVECAH